MKWPNHSDYAEAVQNPELCFEIPELHTGVVATTPLGLPRALSGNFATVYEVSGGGETYAVRCFVRQVTNQQDRYAALQRHLEGLDLPFMVPFEFVADGIRLLDQWYPIVKMQWVTGVPFHNYIEQKLASPERLAWLAADWRGMMADLKRHRIGHGDLQHGNVLVTPEGELRLVDYDGMYIPSFARQRSPELGHANYQHPRRSPELYDERLDHFSEILIYLSLRALAAEPALWHEFFNGDNLIVTAVDLRVPQCSSLWPRLLKSPDHDVRKLTVFLVDQLEKSPAGVPGLETVLTDLLERVFVPAQLEFAAVGSSSESEGVRQQEKETATLVESFVGRAAGPLAAINILRRPNGSRPAPPPPRLADVFGWSALVTALLAMIPPLRSVAGATALVLAVLAWLMPGRRWQPGRVAAALSAVVALACLWVGTNVRVAARLENSATAPPLDLQPVMERADIVPAGPIAAAALGDGHSVVLRPIKVEARSGTGPSSQLSKTLLAEPGKAPMARVVMSWQPHQETVSALIVSADQQHVVSASTDRSLAVWDLNRRAPAFVRTNLVEPVIALTALTNVGIVTTVDAMHHVQWWSLDGGVSLKSSALDSDSLVVPTISPDGQVIALGGENRKQVALYFNTEPATRELISSLSSWAKLVRFTADSRTMAIVCHDDSISLRRVPTGTLLEGMTFPDAGISDVCFADGGARVVAIGEKGAVREWNASNASMIAERRLNLKQPVMAELSGDHAGQFVVAAGRQILLISSSDDLATRAELCADSPVTAIAGLPDGKGFATGHQSGQIAIWHFSPDSSDGIMQLARP